MIDSQPGSLCHNVILFYIIYFIYFIFYVFLPLVGVPEGRKKLMIKEKC